MPDTHRIVIASYVRLYCEGLVACLRGVGGIDVIGVATAPDELLDLCNALAPDVVVLDAAAPMPLPSLDALRRRPRTIAFGVGSSASDVIACAEKGISAYVPRDASVEDLVAAIERVVRGEIVLSPRVAGELWRRLGTGDGRSRPVPNGLTRREQEVLALMRDGSANKEIASRLRISLSTVKNHVHHILDKLGVQRRGQAAAISRA
jgi:two-component system nitrate/nitrite response regulator NarL